MYTTRVPNWKLGVPVLPPCKTAPSPVFSIGHSCGKRHPYRRSNRFCVSYVHSTRGVTPSSRGGETSWSTYRIVSPICNGTRPLVILRDFEWLKTRPRNGQMDVVYNLSSLLNKIRRSHKVRWKNILQQFRPIDTTVT